ncbi:VIT1/CCC1 transporter family protein [Candidatus Pacearchaeota archaeon]|nr:VIT1/CCC1 transporter family protein [Candidatus Pacearchaeota archaeon]HIH52501.1 hypothetical protein [Nanoarchaeota archaeon]
MIKKKDHEELHSSFGGKYLKSWVYGGLDGVVTTFAVVAGVVGASLSSAIILILGFANLIADGISMAVGDYLSTKSQGEYYKAEKGVEENETKKNPREEITRMGLLLIKKGFNRNDAKKISFLISKNKNYQADTMLHDELGLAYENVNPGKNALSTFLAFLIFGMLPLIIFIIGTVFNITIKNSFFWASILSGVSIFLLGVFKSKITNKNWFKSGMITFLIGGIAAVAAYFVGEILSKII